MWRVGQPRRCASSAAASLTWCCQNGLRCVQWARQGWGEHLEVPLAQLGGDGRPAHRADERTVGQHEPFPSPPRLCSPVLDVFSR